MRDFEEKTAVLVRSGVRQGVWTGKLKLAKPVDEAPALAILHRGRKLATADIAREDEDRRIWQVRFRIPDEAMTEGLETITITDEATGLALDHLSIAMGEVIEQNLVAEVSLLRAELDLLKRAFRRHCRDSDTP